MLRALGKTIKMLRVSREMDQKSLAKKAEISISYLSLLERNLRDAPLSTLMAISDALDIPVYVLIMLATPPDEDVKEFYGIIYFKHVLGYVPRDEGNHE